MTAEEVAELAHEIIAADIDTEHDGWCRDERIHLARFVLAVLPVVRASEEWLAHLESRGARYLDGIPGELMDAIDAFNAKAGK
jgi:hypothetical protein